MTLRQNLAPHRRLVAATMFLLCALTTTDDRVVAEVVPPLADDALVEMLRVGGYSLYFRHEATNWSQSDDVRKTEDWLSCDGGRIRHMTKIWNDGASLTQLGWG